MQAHIIKIAWEGHMNREKYRARDGRENKRDQGMESECQLLENELSGDQMLEFISEFFKRC